MPLESVSYSELQLGSVLGCGTTACTTGLVDRARALDATGTVADADDEFAAGTVVFQTSAELVCAAWGLTIDVITGEPAVTRAGVC